MRVLARGASSHHSSLITLTNHTHSHAIAVLILLERVPRHLVETNSRLVRVLDKHELAIATAFLAIPASVLHHIDEGTNDGPTIVKVQVHLRGELAWLVAEHAQDDVVGCVLGAGT